MDDENERDLRPAGIIAPWGGIIEIPDHLSESHAAIFVSGALAGMEAVYNRLFETQQTMSVQTVYPEGMEDEDEL